MNCGTDPDDPRDRSHRRPAHAGSMKTRSTETGADTAPSLAPRMIHIAVTPGEEVVIEASDDLCDWEVIAALRRAVEIWEMEEAEQED